jgi:sugar phosphate isomerase/epimerase
MKFGASSWPFQWDPPYEDTIRRVAGLGFKAIELIAWNKEFLADVYTAPKIAELKKVLAGEGIALSQFVMTPHDLASPDASKRKEAVEMFRRAVDVGVALGSPIINSVACWPFANARAFPRITTKPLVQTFAAAFPGDLNWDQNYKDYVEALHTCGEICRDAKVWYTLEPHPFSYMANALGALRLLEHADSSAIGINFDPSHTFPIGDFPNVSVYQLGKHIKHVHASDNDGVTNVHWRPGMGKIDWKQFLQALKDVGYDGVISIELEDVPGVSRGANLEAPGLYRNKTATDEFVAETVAGADYLKNICKEIGIRVE